MVSRKDFEGIDVTEHGIFAYDTIIDLLRTFYEDQ
jgi:hypothetical protein